MRPIRYSLIFFNVLLVVLLSACTAGRDSAAQDGDYEVISPTRIRAGEATLDVKAALAPDELLVHVRYAFPSGPGKTRLEGDMSQPVKSITARIDGHPVTLKPSGGGGGGGTDGSKTERNQILAFSFDPALKTSEKVHLAVDVTFDDTIGIADPVTFTYDLTVKDALGLYPDE